MAWLTLSFLTDAATAERATAAFEALGAIAVTLEDGGNTPILEPLPDEIRYWNANRVTGLFNIDSNPATLREELQTTLQLPTLMSWRVERVEDTDWERVWLKDFRPMRFGQRLWVCPTSKPPPAADGVNVLLDPGLAFGTGTHPTTALCLEWLDQHPPEGLDMIDYGCGSGILAIAAAKLGAAKVYAVDIDPQALTASAANAERNEVAAHILLSTPDELSAPQADLIVANILAAPLLDLRTTFAGLLQPGGQIVLSGLLDTQKDEIIAAYQELFLMESAVTSGEWAMAAGRRK